MKNVLFLSILFLGAAAYLAGALWPILFPVTAIWTNEKAVRLPEINERLAQLGYLLSEPISMHSGPDRGVALREMQGLATERAQLIADFKNAMNSRQSPAGPLKASGIALAAVGVVVWCWQHFRPRRTLHHEH